MSIASPSDIERFIVALLTPHGALPATGLADFNYVDSGHVDSLGVMDVVVAVEQHFDIELRDDDIMDDAFRTIGGLTAIIARALGGATEAAA